MNNHQYELIGESIWNTYSDMAYLLMGEALDPEEHSAEVRTAKAREIEATEGGLQRLKRTRWGEPIAVGLAAKATREKRLKQAGKLKGILGTILRKTVGVQSPRGKGSREGGLTNVSIPRRSIYDNPRFNRRPR